MTVTFAHTAFKEKISAWLHKFTGCFPAVQVTIFCHNQLNSSWLSLIFVRNHNHTTPKNHKPSVIFFSATTQPNSTKFNMQSFFNPTRRFMPQKIMNQILFDPNFLDPNFFFDPCFFLPKKISDPNFLDPIFFWTQQNFQNI